MPRVYSLDILTLSPFYLDSSHALRRLYLQFAPNSTFAAIPQAHISLAQANMYPQSNGVNGITSIKSQVPHSSVICARNTIRDGNDTRVLQFPDRSVAGCSVDEAEAEYGCGFTNGYIPVNYTKITRQQIWDEFNKSQMGRVIWVDGKEIGPAVGIGAIVVHPQMCTQENNTYLSVSSCAVSGAWSKRTQQLKSALAGNESYVVETMLTPTSFSSMTEWAGSTVDFSTAWAESLNPLTGVQNSTVIDNVLRRMPMTKSICTIDDTTYARDINGVDQENRLGLNWPTRKMHEVLLAALVVNGMSNTGKNIRMWRPYGIGEWNFENANNYYTKVSSRPNGYIPNFQGLVSGFGYSLDGVGIKLSLSILLLYSLFTLTYISYCLATGRSSLTWWGISSFTALALNSTPPACLKNTSAGIKNRDTFRKTVTVLESKVHGRLELVFNGTPRENDDSYDKLIRGQAY
jgi:hypothetical protein